MNSSSSPFSYPEKNGPFVNAGSMEHRDSRTYGCFKASIEESGMWAAIVTIDFLLLGDLFSSGGCVGSGFKNCVQSVTSWTSGSESINFFRRASHNAEDNVNATLFTIRSMKAIYSVTSMPSWRSRDVDVIWGYNVAISTSFLTIIERLTYCWC